MNTKPTLVVALGGNALLKRGEPLEAAVQRKNIAVAARTIALHQHHSPVASGAGARQWPAGWPAGAAKQRLRTGYALSA